MYRENSESDLKRPMTLWIFLSTWLQMCLFPPQQVGILALGLIALISLLQAQGLNF